MVVSASSRELHVGREANVVQLKPCGDVFEEQTSDDWNGKIKEVIDRQDCLSHLQLLGISLRSASLFEMLLREAATGARFQVALEASGALFV